MAHGWRQSTNRSCQTQRKGERAIFKIRPEQIQYIKNQRTPLFAVCDTAATVEYFKSCEAEAESLDKYIRNGDTILSIGAGMAGIEVALQLRHGQDVSLYLLDFDGEVIQGGFDPAAVAYYNSKALTEQFISDNLPEGKVPSYVREDFSNPVDIIFSSLSMGFHYPTSEYQDLIRRTLKVGGYLIFDRRKRTKGVTFGDYEFIEAFNGASDKRGRPILRSVYRRRS